MKKKLISVLLVLIMVACVFPTYAFADFGEFNTVSPMASNTIYSFYDWVAGTNIQVPSTEVCSKTHNRVSSYSKAVQCALYIISDDWQITSMNPGYPDGIYGDNTYNAVYNYQYQKYRQGYLDAKYVDGDTGPKTWPFLKGDYRY